MDAVSKKPPMRPLDPLLIQSFPAPPTHIPVTPTSPNPPPSRPPSTPLPPVPGPSRISGHETFLLLQQGASRSRRSSKLSLASVDRDTTFSRPPSAASPPHSPSSITHPHAIAFSISEELDGLPPADDEDILLGIDVPAQMPSPSRRHNPANESISSIDMRDILDAAGGADYYSDDADTLGALPPLRTPSTRRVHRTNKHTNTLSLADPIDPNTIPRTQKRSSPPAPPRSPPSPDIITILSTTPRPIRSRLYSSSLSTPSAPRLPSTKRRASEGLSVSRSSSRSKPRLSDPILSATRYADSPQGFTYDEDGYADREDMDEEAEDDDDTRSWIDHDEYGKPIPYTKPTSSRSRHEFGEGDRTSFGADDGHYAGEDKDTEVRERYSQLEGYASGSGSGSESSLDLHTPLPHLMVRHGLLSPRSKLLPQPESQANGRESVVSLASTKTNTSLLKDSRDTVTRRVRHRDGKLLKGGIGLTTGLGWSDSEDEDAPSALTRRISSLNLSRRSSLASLSHSTSHHALSRNTSILSHSTSFSHTTSTSHAHPPSRSYSSSTLHEGYMHESELGIDEWGALTRSTSESTQAYKTKAKQPRWSSHSLPSSSSSSARKHQLPKPKTLSGTAPTAWSSRANGSGRMSVASNTSASSGFSSSGVTGMIPEGEEDEGLAGGGGGGERASTSAALLAAGVSASVRRGLAQGPVMRSRTPTSTSSHGVYNGRTPVAVPVPTRRRTEEEGVGVRMNNTSTSSLSTASSLSIPLPITPLDGDDARTTTATTITTTGLAFIDKSLPPLPTPPTPTLRRSPGSANLSASAAAAGGGDKGAIARGGFAFPTQPRARAISSSAVGSGSSIKAPALVGSYSGPPPATTAITTSQMMSPPTPRPLRLAQSPYLRPRTPSSLPTPTRDRPAVPVPVPSIPTTAGPYLARGPLALSGFASNAAASSSTPSLVYHSTPGTPRTTPLEKPKPRTGTGMVYRSATGPSRMRLPSAAAGVGGGGGGGVGAAKVQVQVQAGGPRAIAL